MPLKPRFLQLDRGRSYIRKYDDPAFELDKILPHVNVVFAATHESHTRFSCTHATEVVSFGQLVDVDSVVANRLSTTVYKIPSLIDLATLKTFIKNCDQSHTACGQGVNVQNTAIEQLRLIDCSTRKTILASSDDVYVTLSYRWGEGYIGSHHIQSGMPLDNLPSTIEDAVLVTLGIGLRHLWADAYCIAQDDDSDFQRQIG